MVATRPPTLQDVADRSGVSRGTASRALSGSGRVSAETRARVAAAAAELDFTTNSGARNLRRARAGSIGLWLPQGLASMDYYMNFTFGLVEATNDRELTVSLIPGDYPPGKARGLHVDGFVMADVDGHDPLARAILDSGRPVVTSELVPPGVPEPTASVTADHAAATRLLLDRLREGGAASIVVLIPDIDQMWVRAVHEAAAAWSAQESVGLSFLPLVGVPAAIELRRTVDGLLAARPDVDAIVCVPDGLGVGILSTLQELGRTVPDDVQLVSYVDSATLRIVQPPISALDLRPREAGLRAGQLLVSMLDGGGGDDDDPSPEGGILIETFGLEYHERASTRPRSRPAR
ncbi:DNA-binding LacI/PurR family transcriptional regulator [Agromyces flavus]|uniref:DNA-binding LacI/PurR family transcriptional regulator n=1 Tax=Agromyces flavus TaxID=589382 RepID=A0A1H1WPW3_9MICO|nr:LacI family DNA-binding transcriptional regulator [Agromyces flavus]MCP2366224.1 DNA-binding LacI/PurR family transcriptional regulator [Agromyces flavus]GGI44246.1 putative LacI-family transcriptional regulator [Agromyces flavus]SDS99114.1 DNA-binding transcriptional regulator, LacI/PurR family [Agromyces flavus]